MHTPSWCTWWCTIVALFVALSIDSVLHDVCVHALVDKDTLSDSPLTLAPRKTAFFNMTNKPVVITFDLRQLSEPASAAITISYDGIVDRAVMTLKKGTARAGGILDKSSTDAVVGQEEWNLASSTSVECFSFIVGEGDKVPNLCTVDPLRLSRRIQDPLPLVELTLHPVPAPESATDSSTVTTLPSTLISASLVYASKSDLPLEWFDYLSAPPLPVKSSAVSSTTTKSGTDTGRALRVTSDGNSFTADWDTPTLSQKSSDGDAIDCEECLYLVYYAKLPPGLVGAALSAIKLNTVLNTLRYGTAAGDWTAEKTLTVSVEDKGDYVVNVLAKVDPSDDHTKLLDEVELLTTICSPMIVSLAEDTSSFFWVSLVGLGAIGLVLGGVVAYRRLKERGGGAGGNVLGGGGGGNSGGGGAGFRPMPI